MPVPDIGTNEWGIDTHTHIPPCTPAVFKFYLSGKTQNFM